MSSVSLLCFTLTLSLDNKKFTTLIVMFELAIAKGGGKQSDSVDKLTKSFALEVRVGV